MGDVLLEAGDIYKSFAGVQALRGVRLSIRRGEVRCLVGENGCGKSTLIKVMAGVYEPDGGYIRINGRTYRRLSPIGAIHEGIQVIYQDFSLFPNLTVAENIALNWQLSERRRVVNWKEIRRIAREATERVGVELDLAANVEDLSVASKQLVAITRALLQDARLIIMDEPTTALTRKEVNALFRVVSNLKEKGISVLFVSHKLNEVLEIADRVTVMRNGEVVADGDAGEFDWAKLAYHMTGREIKESAGYPAPPSARQGPSLLRVEGLGQRGGFADVSFTLHPGEVLGITGLLGSGRTELAMALFGLRPADRGRVYVDEKPVAIRSVQDAVRHGFGYVPEDRLTQGLFLVQPIAKNLIAGVVDRLTNRWHLLDGRQEQEEVEAWLSKLRVATPSPLLPVQSLSGGNQQRIVLAKWLATQPRILILNGPTVGVDVASKADIHATILDLARRGMGVLIISDDIPELLHTCGRILVMRRGRIVEELDASRVDENELAQTLTGA